MRAEPGGRATFRCQRSKTPAGQGLRCQATRQGWPRLYRLPLLPPALPRLDFQVNRASSTQWGASRRRELAVNRGRRLGVEAALDNSELRYWTTAMSASHGQLLGP